MNVLIVEDNAGDLKVLRVTLEHYKCRVSEAHDGEEGLELALRLKPDLIISDALMPRMDGFQMLRALKADATVRDIPVIFYSSIYTGERAIELALSLGADAFVLKPVEPEALWEKACGVMKARESRQPDAASPPIPESDERYLREYGVMVAAKLEEKVRELEEALLLRTKAEKALKEQERELAAIFECAPFMMVVDSERRIHRVNDSMGLFKCSAPEMVGKRSGEALGCVYSMFSARGCGFSPDCQDCAIRCCIADTYETGQSHHQVEKTLKIAGDEKDRSLAFLASTKRVMVKNQPMVLLSLQDVTEHRRLEDQLRQAQKMESIGTLAGGIAHDFNNILTVIIGFGQVTLMQMPEGDRLRPNIEQILAAAERASHLTKDLLLFSRKQVADKKAIDLNHTIKTVEKFIVRIIGEDIACTTALTEEAIPVFADPNQLEQVLLNLTTNARDAMPKGGALTIVTERVSLDEAFVAAHGYGSPGVYGVVSVTDTGSGMDESVRQQVFDPFFTTKEVGKGTGLGMSVAYGIIKQHDGFINIYSEPGKGSTFRIYLPIAKEADAVDHLHAEEEKPVVGNETILLAEDDESVRRMTMSLLESFGYQVVVAIDGEDAVRKFRENRENIHLLLFDLIMPKKTGKEAYDEIARLAPDIKVIFASGYASEMIQQRELLDAKSLFTSKPFSPIELLKKVRSILDGAGGPKR